MVYCAHKRVDGVVSYVNVKVAIVTTVYNYLDIEKTNAQQERHVYANEQKRSEYDIYKCNAGGYWLIRETASLYSN